MAGASAPLLMQCRQFRRVRGAVQIGLRRSAHPRAPCPGIVYSCKLAGEPTQGELMAKPNYSHQKKLREQAAKKKREEKLERKQQKKEEAPPPA